MSWLLLGLVVLLVPQPLLRSNGRASLRRVPHGSGAESSTRLRLNHLGAGAAAVTVLVLTPLPWSLGLAAPAAAAALRFLPTGFTRGEDRRALALARSIPESVDLLAAVLRVGITDTEALDLVAAAAPAPLQGHLAAVAAHRRLGAPPATAWRVVASVAALGELATAMARHAETGSPIAALLDRVAADARRDYYSQAQAAARAAAVRAVIPLAVCFLPAFVLLGIVPIVASLVSGLTF